MLDCKCFCDLCVTWMACLQLKGILVCWYYFTYNPKMVKRALKTASFCWYHLQLLDITDLIYYCFFSDFLSSLHTREREICPRNYFGQSYKMSICDDTKILSTSLEKTLLHNLSFLQSEEKFTQWQLVIYRGHFRVFKFAFKMFWNWLRFLTVSSFQIWFVSVTHKLGVQNWNGKSR